MTRLPRRLLIKSTLVGSRLERFAKALQWSLGYRGRARHPELWEIFLEERRTEFALQRLLKRDSCCVDVGCHIGSFLSLLLQLAPAGRHTAIEPSREKAAWLKAKFPEVDVQCVAVGHENSFVTFYEDLARPGFSSIQRRTSQKSNDYQVKMR